MEKPILFSTPMVQAILENRKTMTRRIIKPQPEYYHNVGYVLHTKGQLAQRGNLASFTDAIMKFCPYPPGTKPWVQETWKCTKYNSMDGNLGYEVEFKDGNRKYFEFDDNERFHQFGKFAFKKGWQSPYFMPKEAARIWLEVTSVRVERLQSISTHDVYCEGLDTKIHPVDVKPYFMGLWDSLNAKRGYSWEVNPWVWVIEFKKLEGSL